MRKILIFTFALLCAFSCTNEEDASDIILLVTPSGDLTASAGDKLLFEIQTWTIHERLAGVKVESFDSINGSESLFSETELSERYSGSYIYEVPEFEADQLPITLIFSVSDSEGNTQTKKINLLARNGGAQLKEYSSITLYSAYSGKADAFGLSDFQPVISSTAEEGTLDLYMYVEPELEDKDTFVPEWRSETGVMFARADNMDYSSITKSALNIFYNNSNKTENVAPISDDDIIIIGRENTAIGVVKIILVQDGQGFADDRIVFSFKSAI